MSDQVQAKGQVVVAALVGEVERLQGEVEAVKRELGKLRVENDDLRRLLDLAVGQREAVREALVAAENVAERLRTVDRQLGNADDGIPF